MTILRFTNDDHLAFPPKDIPCILYDDNGDVIREVERFLQNRLVTGMTTSTLIAYAYDLLSFYRFLNSKNISPGGLDDGIDFVLALRKLNAAPRTINRRIAVIKAFLNFYKEGLGDKLFLSSSTTGFYKGVRNKALLGNVRIKKKKNSLSVKVPASLIIPLSPTQIKKFIASLKKYRDLAIIYLMLFCGLRSCEVLALEISDIDFNDDKLKIRGKGQKERFLPISESVKNTLTFYLHHERPHASHNRCFVSLKGISRGRPMTNVGLRTLFRYRRRHALKSAHPHLFRHTFCTNLITQGVSLPVVQKLMGHTDIEITMDYIHMSTADIAQEYHKAINSLESNYGSIENKKSL
ncbi:MAG: tyrosine-type recombinase/integrase [Pseudomonadota bacterium]